LSCDDPAVPHEHDDGENARDALAVLTASYEDTGTMTALFDGIVSEVEIDTELSAKALGMLGGIAAVIIRLVEYSEDATSVEDRAALADLARGTTKDATLHFMEMITVARRLVDYCSQKTGTDNRGILASLGFDLNVGE